MIKSKDDYKYYLEVDRIALGRKKTKPGIVIDEIWTFEKLLRKVEYYHNCKQSKIYKIIYIYTYLKFFILSVLLGFSIPPNVFGPGLSIGHRGTIVVSRYAKIGANCRIHVCTSIGIKAGKYIDVAPKIGNNVYIGPGAKIFGDVIIADGIAIGANSVVNKSFHEKNISIAGVPAKKISDKGSENLLVKATDLLRNNKLK
jgi:serine O-acetyltransferase